jgi:opacity protein-like surface antigen
MKWFYKVALIAACASSTLIAAEKQEEEKPPVLERVSSHGYISTGGLTLTGGWRYQKNHFGVDMGASTFLLIPASVHIGGRYYFNPYTTSKWQHNLSTGLMIGVMPGVYTTYGFQRELKDDRYWFMDFGLLVGPAPSPMISFGATF